MNRNALLLSLALVSLPAIAAAAEPVPVKLMYATASGSYAPLDLDREDTVKWLREMIAAAQTRISTEMPAALGVDNAEIELVSVTHPDAKKTANKIFLQWVRETNPVSFIPLVRYVAKEKMDVYVALQARVTVPGKEVMVFSGDAKTQVDYTPGVQWYTNFKEALGTAAAPLFDEALSKAIASAHQSRSTQDGSQVTAAPVSAADQ
jgi:hypothetical protein